MIDLERFRNINDSLGRPAGDALLRQVAQWLTQHAGDASLVARLDADHFALVLPKVTQDGDVDRLLEQTMSAFLKHPFQLNDAVYRIAAKVGVVLYPDDGTDADTLFKHAEAAVKKAKVSGDRYLFYAQKMADTVTGRLGLENQLRQAVDNHEFVLHYQPKVNLTSGELTGAQDRPRAARPIHSDPGGHGIDPRGGAMGIAKRSCRTPALAQRGLPCRAHRGERVGAATAQSQFHRRD
jgi:diguanylate cyclase (GGDEF)-like protein